MRFTNFVPRSCRLSSRFRSRNCSRLFRYTVGRTMSVAVILSLMASSTPAAPIAAIVALAKESSVSLRFWFHASGLAKSLQGIVSLLPNPLRGVFFASRLVCLTFLEYEC